MFWNLLQQIGAFLVLLVNVFYGQLLVLIGVYAAPVNQVSGNKNIFYIFCYVFLLLISHLPIYPLQEFFKILRKKFCRAYMKVRKENCIFLFFCFFKLPVCRHFRPYYIIGKDNCINGNPCDPYNLI